MMDPRSSLSDTELVARVRAGQRDCFRQLVDRYERALLRVAASRLGRADWAEDVVQEAFLAAFKSLGTFDGTRNFRTWLWTILLNQCKRHYQRQTRSVLETASESGQSLDSSHPTSGESPLIRLMAKERSAQLDAILSQLSPAQADALRLRFFGGLKFQEIATAMSSSTSAAKVRVRTGLERMAELLGDDAATLRGDMHEESEGL